MKKIFITMLLISNAAFAGKILYASPKFTIDLDTGNNIQRARYNDLVTNGFESIKHQIRAVLSDKELGCETEPGSLYVDVVSERGYVYVIGGYCRNITDLWITSLSNKNVDINLNYTNDSGEIKTRDLKYTP